MFKVLQGIKVVEVAEWLFVPSAAATLADWGADVIKIEHPVRGDGIRGLTSMMGQKREALSSEATIQLVNRGKRNIGVDISTESGKEVLYELVKKADVFLTSLLPGTRDRLGISATDIRACNERIIYASGTGWGSVGERSGRPGFDLAQVWASAGFAHVLSEGADEPPMMPFSIGDLSAGVALAGGIAGALFQRERTGEAEEVSVSLFHVGMWMASQRITGAAAGDSETRRQGRMDVTNPLVCPYRTKDDRWMWLVFIQSDRWWPDLCTHIGRQDLIHDPRFSDFLARQQNCGDLIEVLDSVFVERTLAEWSQRFRTLAGVWGPVSSPSEVSNDEQAIENGFLVDIPGSNGMLRLVTTPVQFSGEQIGDLHLMSEFAEDTEAVLLELGYDWGNISDFKTAEVIG